jgi:hypothetical protein
MPNEPKNMQAAESEYVDAMSSNKADPDDSIWEWVATSYRATPPSRRDINTFVDTLMQEVKSTSTTVKIGSHALHHGYRPSSTFLWPAVVVSALLIVFAGGIWIGRLSVQESVDSRSLTRHSSPMDSEIHSTVAAISTESSSNVSTTSSGTARTVQFVLSAPHASQVTLVGDFNGWDVNATPMISRPGSGLWTVSVSLPPGRHVYAFVIDGDEWIADPAAPQVAVDAFGSSNSVIVVGGST